ncbi:hypothetical protein PHLCEN_2v8064 [Hermanssonia centrifuga]|uniref:Uncharacterized protein n=1 Tax=Hermanssonia centrifuga TaxID=98765 RepID=A0A2R6NUQ2_9APHY|nr:hypothetical protein PHLCEN_2v8064 [Hermanssonia centrifuga]
MIAFLTLLPFALGAFASPIANLARDEPGPWCNGLGPGAFDIAYNFTLDAYNSTLPNSNSTGAPVVIGQAGAVDGASFKIFSTWASYPYNDYPNFSLLSGAFHPNYEGGLDVGISDSNVTAGNPPSFIVTSLDLPAPAQIYCGVADTDPYGGGTGYPLLAVNGDTDSFALCSAGDYYLAQTNVIYKPTADNSGQYLFDSCYSVKLQMIGLY